jgi:hypothetical protein
MHFRQLRVGIVTVDGHQYVDKTALPVRIGDAYPWQVGAHPPDP